MQILVVDDHALYCAGLRLLLQAALPGVQVDGCSGGVEALRRAGQRRYDLVLLDWEPGSRGAAIEVLRALKMALPATRIVVVSGDADVRLIRHAIDAGAVGFVPKDAAPASLIDALAVAAGGGLYLPAAALVADAAGGALPASAAGACALRDVRELFPGLAPRDVAVLERLVLGMPGTQIAQALGIAEGTLKECLDTIFRALGVDSRTGAVYALARRRARLG